MKIITDLELFVSIPLLNFCDFERKLQFGKEHCDRVGCAAYGQKTGGLPENGDRRIEE